MKQKQIVKKEVRKKDRKDRKDRFLLVDYGCLSDEDRAEKAVGLIEKRILSTMRFHIGKENPIKPVALFEKVYGFSPFMLDTYRRAYWWNIIKTIIRKMRREGTCFIINKGQFLFVLKTQDECNEFKKQVDRHITQLKKSKMTATKWVREQRWKYL